MIRPLSKTVLLAFVAGVSMLACAAQPAASADAIAVAVASRIDLGPPSSDAAAVELTVTPTAQTHPSNTFRVTLRHQVATLDRIELGSVSLYPHDQPGAFLLRVPREWLRAARTTNGEAWLEVSASPRPDDRAGGAPVTAQFAARWVAEPR